VEVDEQTTDHNRPTVPGSLAGGTRGSAQQAWGNRLETDPQQMQESRLDGQQDGSHISSLLTHTISKHVQFNVKTKLFICLGKANLDLKPCVTNKLNTRLESRCILNKHLNA